MLYGLNFSNNLFSFQNAVSTINSPGLNISYVDKEGNIAWFTAGRFPVRDSNINAKTILDGSDPNHKIKSFVSFEDNPYLINPKSGIIITANNLPSTNKVGEIPRLDGYFRSSDRASRIFNLISKKQKWSINELKKIQNDNFLINELKV